MTIAAKVIVFRESTRPPANEHQYVDRVVDSRFGRDRPQIVESRVLLTPPGNMLHFASAGRWYKQLVAAGNCPDFGMYSDYWSGTDADGCTCVGLFFNADEAPLGGPSAAGVKRKSWWRRLFG